MNQNLVRSLAPVKDNFVATHMEYKAGRRLKKVVVNFSLTGPTTVGPILFVNMSQVIEIDYK